MPERRTIQRAKATQVKKRAGYAPTTQAGEFVRQEMRHIQKGKRKAKSKKQAVAIGLSKARRAGIRLPSPKKSRATPRTRSHTAISKQIH